MIMCPVKMNTLAIVPGIKQIQTSLKDRGNYMARPKADETMKYWKLSSLDRYWQVGGNL